MRVYLSSTYNDLIEHRAAAVRAIRKAGFDCNAMEEYAASDERPLDYCLRDVAKCDVYVGLFAHRYGFIPEGRQESITQLEYREAKSRQIPALIFLLAPDHPWEDGFRDSGEQAEKLASLRSTLQAERLVSYFTTPAQLATEVLAALHRQRRPQRPALMVESLPPDYVHRGREFDEIKSLLLAVCEGGTVGITAALKGCGRVRQDHLGDGALQ